jgi:hypothetical protein
MKGVADVKPKFTGFIFFRLIILKEVYKALNRLETLPQLENKIKIQNFQGKKHEIQK